MKIIRLDHDVVNAVFTTDYHLSDIPPGRRTSAYRHEIIDKLRFVIALANRIRGVSFCGGDVFHQKHPRAVGNTFSLLGLLILVLREALTGTVYGAHGNHDLLADRVESIPGQPIGTLIASGAYTDLSTESVIFENRDGSIRVQVDAYPYTSDDMAALDRVLAAPPREPGVTYRVVLMHQYGNPGENPTMHGKPSIGFNRMAQSDYDLALWGHDHSRTETVQTGNCTHVRLGSLSRASLSEDQVDRPVAAAVFSFTKDRIKYQEKLVPTKPLEAAFVEADRAVEKVRNSDVVTQFFSAMDTAVADVESNDPREVLKAICPEDERKIYDLALDVCGL